MAGIEITEPTSQSIAENREYYEIWDREVPFPSPKTMEDVDIITQVSVEKAQKGKWHYLHEAAIQWHKDRFYACWANNPLLENFNHDEIIRGTTSFDGIHWSEPTIWVEPPALGATSFNHPLLFDHNDVLYAFLVAWYGKEHMPTAEIFALNDETGEWEHQEGSGLLHFLPFCTPQKMKDGNWILSGENYWYQSCVAISHGEDMTKWDLVNIPNSEVPFHFPESAVIVEDDRIINICRTCENPKEYAAPCSVSYDFGRTWEPIKRSNWPMPDSQPFAGRLSTGQNYLIADNLEENRHLLTVAVTEPGGGKFKKIYKVRHQAYPLRRLFGGYGGPSCVGETTEWSYPNAFEHDGNLYIIYSEGKEDCVLSIIPVDVLKI